MPTLVNGCLSATIDLLRGCRQGDPIATYLLILSIEILLSRLEKSKLILPWTSKKELEHHLEEYADDLSIFLQFLGLKHNKMQFEEIIRILKDF